MTPTEILAAWNAGADMVKVFPAAQLGGADISTRCGDLCPRFSLFPPAVWTFRLRDPSSRLELQRLGWEARWWIRRRWRTRGFPLSRRTPGPSSKPYEKRGPPRTEMFITIGVGLGGHGFFISQSPSTAMDHTESRVGPLLVRLKRDNNDWWIER